MLEVSSRALRDLVQVFDGEDLHKVGELDPYRLGATGSIFGRAGEYGCHDHYVERTANKVDERLAQALAEDQLVVLVGPSKAGKTRTMFEAVRSYDSAARVVWPILDGTGELAIHPRIADSDDTLVVWLDDLHVYLTSEVPLTPAVLARLSARRGRTMVVATLRSEMRAQMRGGGELRQETRMLLDQVLTIDLASTSDDPGEHAAAGRAYPEQAGDGHGLGEVLAGAPELLARYSDARAAAPQLHAVIAVAVDWARIGRTDPIPEPVLVALALGLLRSTHPHIDATSTSVLAAAVEARTPPPGSGRTAALHTSFVDADTRGYRAFDYLIAADDGQDHRARRPIPESYWHEATRDCDAKTLVVVGGVAYRRSDEPGIAFTLFLRAADAGSSSAMHNLGVLLNAAGDRDGAEAWFLKAADAGHTAAMTNLGVLLRQRGEEAEAEAWYRKAVAAGDVGAMHNLGVLLDDRGDKTEAGTWYREAAGAGHSRAMSSLGVLLAKRGDHIEAEALLRKATGMGDTHAMTNLGFLLLGRGDHAEAEALLRRAAKTEHPHAMMNLGVLLAQHGDRAGAECWYRKAADYGDIDAMQNLGVLLAQHGDPAGAETWLRNAAEAGNDRAMTNLGVLLEDRGEQGGAETWLRKAAEAGNDRAIINLGLLLASRGDQVEAETWFRKAADIGNTAAMTNLGVLLEDRGEQSGAETWYRRAADAGDPAAMNNLGVLLKCHGDRIEAGIWLQKAAEAGSVAAVHNLRD